MRTTRFTSSLVVALSTLALAACGGNGDSAAGGGKDTADGRKDGALKFAQCMRKHGVDMPDPKTDENGRVVIEGGGPGSDAMNDPDMKTADAACRKFLQDALPPKLTEAEQKEFKDKALSHAKCMRERGIDFPDPRIGEAGDVSVEIGGNGIDPDSPRFKEAQKKCGDPLDPAGATR
jgi:hypothetical protein